MTIPGSLHFWTWIWIALAAVTFVVLLLRTAPYGRYANESWGPTVPHRLGWIVMEFVSPLALIMLYLNAESDFAPGIILLAGLWIAHYLHRALIYPFRARWAGKNMPVVIMLSAIFFNSVNGSLNGIALSHLDTSGFWTAWTTWLGLSLFVFGAATNLLADTQLIRLRQSGDSGYQIPQGNLFKWISCPNYLGELVEWTGFAIVAGTLPALSFAIWTAANLVPRAMAHHQWYRDQFPSYPSGRKAIIPFIL